jgi:hypothetical protein
MFIKNVICNHILSMVPAYRLRDTNLKVTKKSYSKLLSVVARNGPMSAYEIMNALNPMHKPTPPRHVYRMVKKLSGQETIEGKRYPIWGGPKYLDTNLKTKNLNRIDELEKERKRDFHQIVKLCLGYGVFSSYSPVSYEDEQAMDEIKKMCSDPGNYRYSLSIRGLLLLSYDEPGTKIKAGKKERMGEVLESPATLDVAPFLLNWKDFEQAGFKVVNTLEKLSQELFHYIVDEKTENDSLLLKAMQRYSNEVLGHFYLYHRLGILADKIKKRNQEFFREYIELNIPNKLTEYHRKMLNFQKILLSKELTLIEQRLEGLQ